MCKVINFNEYRGNKVAQERKQTVKRALTDRKLRVQELMTVDWMKEYIQKGWSISKMLFHIIEQYGYIRCEDGKKYVFEEIRRDARYNEMYPEVGNKRYKAPLWVKVKGEWYFVELYNDPAKEKAFDNKWIEIGNYNVKGFLISSYDLKMGELKKMWEKLDIVGLAKKLNDDYYDSYNIVIDESRCDRSVVFGTEKTSRDCTYKLMELEQYGYAILEGTEIKTGSKHMVLLYEKNGAKEHAKYFKEQYGNAGVPLLYRPWNSMEVNWKVCIGRNNRLYKRLVMED